MEIYWEKILYLIVIIKWNTLGTEEIKFQDWAWFMITQKNHKWTCFQLICPLSNLISSVPKVFHFIITIKYKIFSQYISMNYIKPSLSYNKLKIRLHHADYLSWPGKYYLRISNLKIRKFKVSKESRRVWIKNR